jgi:hypothetical protein
MKFPENFDLLHQGEEFIRARSKEAISTSEILLHHFNMVSGSMTLIDHFARSYKHKSEDQLIIQFLGIRLFNGLASASGHLLSGYYQSSVMQQRDILEVSFLLDYFKTTPSLIVEWKSSTEGERNKKFGAFHIRKALDDRDAFTSRKREEHYKLLCNLGGHASYQGFQMLQPIAGSDAHCGPYFADRALNATMAELAKIACGAGGNFTRHFTAASLIDYETKLHFMEKQAAWFDAFFGEGFDRGQIDRMRDIVARLKVGAA